MRLDRGTKAKQAKNALQLVATNATGVDVTLSIIATAKKPHFSALRPFWCSTFTRRMHDMMQEMAPLFVTFFCWEVDSTTCSPCYGQLQASLDRLG